MSAPTARDLYNLVRQRYGYDKGWLVMDEIELPMFERRGRRADAICLGMWQSNWRTIHGFEVKVSRQDWMNELENPAKAQAGMEACSYWWLVAPRDIVKANELPANWGWFAPDSKGTALRKQKQAKNLGDREPSSFLRKMVNRIVKTNFYDHERTRQVSEARDEGYKRGFEAGKKHKSGDDADYRIRELLRLGELAEKLEDQTGGALFHLRKDDGPLINALRLVLDSERWRGVERELREAVERGLGAVKSLRNLGAELKRRKTSLKRAAAAEAKQRREAAGE